MNCGQAIETEWKWIATEMEIRLVSSMDKERRKIAMSGIKRTTHYFKNLMSNTEYSVWLRGINYKEKPHCYDLRWGFCSCDYYYSKAVEMSWEKIQLMTLAGIIWIFNNFSATGFP